MGLIYTNKESGTILKKRYFNDCLNEETVGDDLVREGKEFHVLIILRTNDEYKYCVWAKGDTKLALAFWWQLYELEMYLAKMPEGKSNCY